MTPFVVHSPLSSQLGISPGGPGKITRLPHDKSRVPHRWSARCIALGIMPVEWGKGSSRGSRTAWRAG